MTRRVVITGAGVISPLGTGLTANWDAILEGRSGAGPITQFDAADYPTRFAAEVKDFEPLDYLDRADARRLDRFCQLAVAAARMTIEDSGLAITDDNAERVGVIIGSGIGGLHVWEREHAVLLEKGPRRVSPFLIPMMIGDMASGYVSILHGAKGPNMAVVTACATGTNAIGDAAEIVKRGDAEVMIAGGAEAPVTPLGFAGFCSMRAISARNDAPTRASRPFDRDRDGFVVGEGAGVVVVEALEHAQARGAKVYAEIIGYGMSGDAYHITAPAPNGAGAARSMRAALGDAGLEPEAVDYINAHGTSTSLNDQLETEAVKTVFGEHAYRLAISSSKSQIGHTLGAAGAIELIYCLLALQHQTAPPTINYEHPDPACDLDYVPNTARPMRLTTVMSNSFGFGGHNAVLIIRQYADT